jgi:NADPH:quinone reductase-like Zn-dependent oxidoreductase
VRAAFIEERGPAECVRHGDLPEPRPGPTDVLIDVTATAVDPVDTFVRSGVFRTPLPMPFIVGRDAVGTVVGAGPGAAGFAPGQRVWCASLGHDGRQGAAAERAVVPADRLYPLPDGVDPEVAVAVAHPGATAHLALFAHAGLRPGETVFVAGAAGSVGSALVTMAVEAGARVVAGASARDLGHVRGLGAAEVLDYRLADLGPALRAACPGGIDVFLDTSGRNDLALAVEHLAFRGRIVLLAGGGSRPVLPVGPLYTKDASILGFVISHATADELRRAAGAVNRLLAAGRLRPRRIERLPLSAMAEAHRRVERGGLHGTRLVVRPDLDR